MHMKRSLERERMNSSEERLKVLMFPYLATGHISPFVELAQKLSHRNFEIYIYSTPANLNFIKNKITENYALYIHLLELHLYGPAPSSPPHHQWPPTPPPPHSPSSPQNCEADFLKSSKALRPDLVIADFVLPWARSIALMHGIPAVAFTIFNSAALLYYFHLTLRPEVEFPFPAIRLKDYEQSAMLPKDLEYEERDADDSPNEDRVIVLMNSSRVIEEKYMGYAGELMSKWEITPIGALDPDSGSVRESQDGDELIAWLGRKDAFSSVLVAFGSQYFLKGEEMEEIAYGLEMSNVNFIWLIRAPEGEEFSVEESLPRGFLERVRERGRVVEKWAPQAKILSHSGIGGFVSHCGWSSLLESIDSRVPIIAMPIHLDQPINARVVGELGIGVEVARDVDGKLQREEISQAIRDVVVGKRGEILRRRIEEIGECQIKKQRRDG